MGLRKEVKNGKRGKMRKMRSLYDIKNDLEDMSTMSCKPSMKRPKNGDIIDENNSVKWNREEVIRLQNVYDNEVKMLNTAKNKRRDELFKELYKVIRHEVGGITINDANEIFKYVYNNSGSGWTDCFDKLEEIIQLVSGIING